MMRCLKSSEASQSSYYDIASKLEVDIHVGLSEYEVGQRRRNHGYNEFDITSDDPLWKKYLDQASVHCVPSQTVSCLMYIFLLLPAIRFTNIHSLHKFFCKLFYKVSVNLMFANIFW